MDCQKYAVFWVDLDQSLEVEKPMSLDIPDSFPFVRLEHYEGNLQNHHKRNKMLYNLSVWSFWEDMFIVCLAICMLDLII